MSFFFLIYIIFKDFHEKKTDYSIFYFRNEFRKIYMIISILKNAALDIICGFSLHEFNFGIDTKSLFLLNKLVIDITI